MKHTTTRNASFSGYAIAHGMVHNESRNKFPTMLYGFETEEEFDLTKPGSTFYGFVMEGHPILHIEELQIPLKKGMYFCVPGDTVASITGGDGLIVERIGFKGVFSLG